MRGINKGGRQARLLAAASLAAVAVFVTFGSTAASAPDAADRAMVTITVNSLPISNGLPLDLGVRKGFFAQQGIEINRRNLQSGNDIVLALSNSQGDIGYVGWVPLMLARMQRIPLVAVAASDVEGTNVNDNWQNILVRGSSSIRTPADLAGKTIAVNALKGVGEVMIKAALQKVGVNPNSVNLTPLAFPAMPAALNNNQVDAIWTPEPFMSQALGGGARIVMAPGPVLGRFFPIGVYVAREDWVRRNRALAARFQRAMNRSLAYAQANPNEVRELLPAATRNVRLPIWSPLADREQLNALARYAREFAVISSLPNMALLVPRVIPGGKTLQGAVGRRFILLRQDGKAVTRLAAGRYTFVVQDRSRAQAFRLVGPGVRRQTGIAGTGRATWTLALRRGTYVFSTVRAPIIRRTFRVA